MATCSQCGCPLIACSRCKKEVSQAALAQVTIPPPQSGGKEMRATLCPSCVEEVRELVAPQQTAPA